MQWLILKDGGNTVVSFIVFTLLARLVSVEAFGLIAAALIAISVFQLVVSQGFAAAIIQRRDVEPEHLDSAFWVSVAIGSGLCLILLATAGPIAWLLTGREPELIPKLAAVLRWLSLGFVLMSMQSVPQALLQRELAFKPLAIRAMIANLVGGGAGVGMALSGFGVWSLVGQLLSTKAISIVLLWGITEWRPGLRFSWPHLQEIFGFSLKMLGFNLVSFGGKRADQLLIAAALGPVSLGFYAIASKLSELLVRVTSQTLGLVTFPIFSRIQHDEARFREAFYTISEYAAAITMPIFIGTILTAPELMTVIFREKWAASTDVLRWLALLGLIESLLQTSSSVVLARGRAGLRFWMACGTVVVNVAVFGVVIWLGGGMLEVAIAAAIRGYTFLPVWLLVIRRVAGVSLGRLGRRLLPPVAATGVMALAVIAVRVLLDRAAPVMEGWLLLRDMSYGQPLVRLLAMVATGGVVYGVALVAIRPALVSGLFEMLPVGRGRASPAVMERGQVEMLAEPPLT